MAPPLKPGQNPRDVLPRHRERGPKRWTYTYADLARLFGMTEGSTRQAVAKGRVDPASLESVVAFATKRRSLPRGNDGGA